MAGYKRKHKYIEKIGDRYFYTMKELQAYYNGKKAAALTKMSSKVAKIGANAAVKAYRQSWDEDSSVLSQRFNEKLYKACFQVSKILGKSAAKSAAKVIEANAAIRKRQVDRYIEEKYDNTEDVRYKILKSLNRFFS